MGGEQDMRRMGNLKKYMPVTFATMMIGTLAIAGIPPFAGFFSKDEILFRAFLANKFIWVLAVATALMTAFYMWRLMAMTFFGAYRGPAWEAHDHGHQSPAVSHSTHDAHDAHDAHGDAAAQDDHGGGHGHGPWHGPHESPAPMTMPLQALAIGAIVAGLIGIPAALGGGNTLEHFLEPSFSADHRIEDRGLRIAEGTEPESGIRNQIRNPQSAIRNDEAEPHASRAEELGLMAFSVIIAAIGIAVAQKFYVTSPEISDQLAERWAGAHRTLSHKYYVDELYNATVISGTFAAGTGLWAVDRTVVDGAVNGTGRLTVISSWFSGLTDRTVVDGLVNLVGWIVQESSLAFRRFQTGLVQNYALLMLFGVFAFVGVYLFVR
jgi:NADH-quinone oxidoreductase subunit L